MAEKLGMSKTVVILSLKDWGKLISSRKDGLKVLFTLDIRTTDGGGK